MGLNDLYEFILAADRNGPPISTEHWSAIKERLLHLQPAASVRLEGDPPRIIRVKSYGGTEIAPALLGEVERLASTALRVELTDG